MMTSERLYPFQVDGVNTLLAQPAVLLADDMGLGKTVQTIAALRALLESKAIASALIVAPAPLLRQWRGELECWLPGVRAVCIDGTATERDWKWKLNKQVYLISYDSLRNDLSRAMRVDWDLVVLDEAQRIKSRQAHVSRACKSLVRQRAWALTGTPLENHEDELASVLEFVRPVTRGLKPIPLSPGARLRSLQAQLQLRRRKCDVLKDLPPKTVIRVPLELTTAQRRRYQEEEAKLRQQLAGLGSRVTVVNVLQVISRLKQICNFCPDTGESAKLDDLRRRLAALARTGSRALVFSQWTNAEFGIARLQAELAEYKVLTYSGDLDLAERNARVNRFQADPKILAFLISLRAGGQGLNLQTASYVFHFDRWWNPAVENQATDRSHRMGQTQPVTVYCYTTLSTIEERIETILQQKLALFAEVVDLVSLDPARLMNATELFGLLGMAPPPALKSAPPPQTSLCERAMRLLEKNGWDLHCNGHLLQGRRSDELGLPDEIYVLDAESCGSAILTEFLASDVCAKKVLLGTGHAVTATHPGVIVWDASVLDALEAAR